MRETPSARSTRLAQIQQQITAGTYETPQRLAAAIDALARQLEVAEETPPPRRAK